MPDAFLSRFRGLVLISRHYSDWLLRRERRDEDLRADLRRPRDLLDDPRRELPLDPRDVCRLERDVPWSDFALEDSLLPP